MINLIKEKKKENKKVYYFGFSSLKFILAKLSMEKKSLFIP